MMTVGDIIKRPVFLPEGRRPGYSIMHHPRAYNKPLLCQLGQHPIGRMKKILGPAGIPHMYCTACGSSMAEGLFKGTWSKQDIDKLTKIKASLWSAPKKPRTKKEMMETAWRKHNETRQQRRDRMQASIAEYVHERLLDQ